MNASLKLIDQTKLSENSIDISAFISTYKASMMEDNYFYSNDGICLESYFELPTWMVFNELEQQKLTISFQPLFDMRTFGLITNEEIDLVKCFIIYKSKEGLAKTTISSTAKSVVTFITETSNFNKAKLSDKKGSIISILFNSPNKKPITRQHVIDYIYFLDEIDCAEDTHLMVLNKILTLPQQEYQNNVRELPSNKDILAFDFYLKKFYTEETDELLLNLFKPVLLWWKITNVIPIRPSEFSYKTKPNCITRQGDSYTLHIDRVKVTSSAKKNKRRASIPILNKFTITKEIYDLIEDYKLSVKSDANRNTLLSYQMYKTWLLQYMKKYRADVSENLFSNRIKEFSESFTRATLDNLITMFYKEIIERKYNDFSIKQYLKPGDTRHLAFCSLMLQGVSPIEIAMLGGHTNVITQNHYVGHVSYFLDSEMINFISNKSTHSTITSRSLKNIILKKNCVPPKALHLCSKTDDGIGYCTLDYTTGSYICDDVSHCIFCSHWWCEPSNENYIMARKYLETNSLSPLKDSLNKEQHFLKKLLDEAQIVTIDDMLEIDKKDSESIQEQVLKIKSTSNKILHLQKSLLDIHQSKLI